jgi:hypothetical protein
MKRDWDVIRAVLLEIEESDESNISNLRYDSDAGDTVKAFHAFMLQDAGMISGKSNAHQKTLTRVLLTPKLTWEGRELLDTLRSKPLWEKMKAKAASTGIEITFDSLKALAKWALGQMLA